MQTELDMRLAFRSALSDQQDEDDVADDFDKDQEDELKEAGIYPEEDDEDTGAGNTTEGEEPFKE